MTESSKTALVSVSPVVTCLRGDPCGCRHVVMSTVTAVVQCLGGSAISKEEVGTVAIVGVARGSSTAWHGMGALPHPPRPVLAGVYRGARWCTDACRQRRGVGVVVVIV